MKTRWGKRGFGFDGREVEGSCNPAADKPRD